MKAGKNRFINVFSEQERESARDRKRIKEVDIISDLDLRYIGLASKC